MLSISALQPFHIPEACRLCDIFAEGKAVKKNYTCHIVLSCSMAGDFIRCQTVSHLYRGGDYCAMANASRAWSRKGIKVR